jgi:hypothetical protein
MSVLLDRLPLVCVLLASFGCASPPRAADADTGKLPEPIIVPTPEPPTMVVQFSNLRRDWPAIIRLFPPDSEMSSLREVAFDDLLPNMVGPSMASVVAFTERCEVGFYGDLLDDNVEPAAVLAFVVEDTQAALAQLQNDFVLTELSTGAVRLLPRPSLVTPMFDDQSICELWGQGRGAITCSLITEYTPGRGLAMAERVLTSNGIQPTDTAALEIPAQLLTRSIHSAAAPQNISEATGLELIDGVLADLGLFRIGLSLLGGEPIMALELEFQARASVLTSTLLDAPGPLAPDPALFRLPKDSDVAAQFAGMPRGHRSQDVRALFDGIFAAMGQESGFDRDCATALGESFSRLFLTGGPSIVAVGMDEDAYLEALGRLLAHQQPSTRELTEFYASSDSWVLLGLSEPAEQWQAEFHRMHELDVRCSNPSAGSPGKARPVKPTAKRGSVAPLPGKPTRTISWVAKPPRAAGAGVSHYVSETLVNPEFADRIGPTGLPPAARELHMLIAGVGEHVWICRSAQLDVCVGHINALRKGGPATLEDHTLRARLTQMNGTIVGLTSIAGIAGLMLDDTSLVGLRDSQQQLLAVRAQAGVLRRPLAISAINSLRGDGGTLRVEAGLSVPEILALAGWFAG